MEQDSMSNIWNSKCIMQARHAAGRSYELGGGGMGAPLLRFNYHFYDIKVWRENINFVFLPQQIPGAPSAPFARPRRLSAVGQRLMFCALPS